MDASISPITMGAKACRVGSLAIVQELVTTCLLTAECRIPENARGGGVPPFLYPFPPYFALSRCRISAPLRCSQWRPYGEFTGGLAGVGAIGMASEPRADSPVSEGKSWHQLVAAQLRIRKHVASS